MNTRRGASPAVSPACQGRTIPSFFMRKASVERFRPRRTAAPLGPASPSRQTAWRRPHTCLAQALGTIEDVEVPLAAWRVHATAAVLNERTGKSGEADHHHALSRAMILQLAQSLP